ncbi:MAG: hypothetical protein ACE37E_01240 [Hyphomicrobiales bacterium]
MADAAHTTEPPGIDRRMAIIGLAAGVATGRVLLETHDELDQLITQHAEILRDLLNRRYDGGFELDRFATRSLLQGAEQPAEDEWAVLIHKPLS